MNHLVRAVPDPTVLVAMEPEELAQHLLRTIKEDHGGTVHPSSFDGRLFQPGSDAYDRTFRPSVLQAIMEAMAWLKSEALLVPKAGDTQGWCSLSRRADRLVQDGAFKEYRNSRLLPRELLHRSISDNIWMNLMGQKYDLAVFESMRAVEIGVREASGIDDLGVKLMRRAFHPETGPLTDMTVEPGERQARADLFAGAIGSYKNPVSHRHVPLSEAGEVIEHILLASHLLRIVDSRRAAKETVPVPNPEDQ